MPVHASTASDVRPITDLCSRFGFHTLPFTRELAVKDRFVHPDFDAALEPLVAAVSQRMSGALIAPAGTAKSALLRALCARLTAGGPGATWARAVAADDEGVTVVGPDGGLLDPKPQGDS